MYRINKLFLVIVVLGLSIFQPLRLAAQNTQPLSSKEIVSLLYQLPTHPEKRDDLVDEIRKRGIGFPLTDGMRSLVATKRGNDALLGRPLQKADSLRFNATPSALPSETEG